MSRLRVLVLAQGANPDSICGPLIAYSQAQALARLHDVTLVIGASNEHAVRRKQGTLHSVEVVRVPLIDRVFAWSVKRVFKNNYNNQLLQAFIRPFSLLFEWQAWRQMRARIKDGKFDVVLRLLPVSMINVSPFAFFLRNGPIPFLIGPVNGGLPWLPGFRQATIQNKWVTRLRSLYPFLPFGPSTYRRAAAIMAGSSHTYAELSAHREKLFFLPENGIDDTMCSSIIRSRKPDAKLELIFVGSLIPLKACDLALRGAAPLLRDNLARFTVVGDGPERSRLERLARSLGVDKEVMFLGWLRHDAAVEQLRSADVLLFPSIRDFGGGVVFEALSLGVVPVVADFGGPGDIVQPGVGFKVSLTNEADVVSQIEDVLRGLEQDRDRLCDLQEHAVSYAREHLTWDAKAQVLTSVMRWTLRQAPKPDMPPPKTLYSTAAPSLPVARGSPDGRGLEM